MPPASRSVTDAPMSRSVTVDTKGQHLGVTLSNCQLHGIKGCVIDEVNPADILANSGLRAKDVIIKLNGEAIATHQEAMAIIAKRP